jgi:raffinose/stachyose/melibiose transport system permease protein
MEKQEKRMVLLIERRMMVFIKIFFLTFVALTMILPFYWVFMSSFKNNIDIFGKPFSLPKSISFENYFQAWYNARIGFSMLNSLFYSGISIAIIVIISAMVSYVLVHVRPNRILYAYFSFGLLIPIHAVIIPLNVILRQMYFANTRAGLVIAYIVSNLSFSIFLLTAVMRSIPKDLIDASSIDGCTGNQVFINIILPLSKAGIASIGTFAFINCWNDLLLGMVLANSRNLQTINVAVTNLRASFSDSYSVLAAGITCMYIPSVIIYTIFQEQIMKGMISGAIKG